ncbi:MAG TPA: hydrogenase maturation nickel metallochaperone HypA [bacterium]|nr:hydrogenase maturation nickel metallochaperone HypA [bacterium]
MHELSIALSLVDVATSHLRGTCAGRRVDAVHLRLGPLAGVDPDALRCSFTLACRGTVLDGARLVIEEVPVVAYCAGCGRERVVPGIVRLRCPACGSLMPVVRRGDELELTALEVEDDAAPDR